MKALLFLSLLFTAPFVSKAQQSADSSRIVEASCGQCKFGMKGKGCSLAVRFDGQAYFVDGTAIDSHGDAHADDGFCNAIRKARVSGKVVNGRFAATSFVLLPAEKRSN